MIMVVNVAIRSPQALRGTAARWSPNRWRHRPGTTRRRRPRPAGRPVLRASAGSSHSSGRAAGAGRGRCHHFGARAQRLDGKRHGVGATGLRVLPAPEAHADQLHPPRASVERRRFRRWWPVGQGVVSESGRARARPAGHAGWRHPLLPLVAGELLHAALEGAIRRLGSPTSAWAERTSAHVIDSLSAGAGRAAPAHLCEGTRGGEAGDGEPLMASA